ncbi:MULTISPECIES: hypothetical protein [Weeksella]|uniref:hypothetical protein n=1 Tax=Weeksella TaxID=1013 RepID=UPI0008A2A5AA|nr:MULTISPECIES: hypothetical protein [Weeksella]MDK7375696.1 hypothetical protein [Weeksella virosa]OFM83490.1 hypothetical protein HMPREF2660_01450 [Weeksella sp. HMSC059D05]
MKRLLVLSCFFISLICCAQKENNTTAFDWINSKSLTVDEARNFYQLKNNTIEKISNHQIVATFTNQNNLSNLNVQSSLLVTVIANHQTLYLLDNNLSPIQDPISLNSPDYFLTLVGVMDNNFLVAYDIFTHKLLQINYQSSKIINSSSILTMLKEDEQLIKLYYHLKKIYLLTDQSLYVFDDYLTYQKKINLPTYSKIVMVGNAFLYGTKNEIFLSRLDQTEPQVVYEGNWSDFAANSRELFVQNDKDTYIYTLKEK